METHPVSVAELTGRGGAELALPQVGMGLAFLGNLNVEITDSQAVEAIHTGITAGLTYLDTAPLYGLGLSERRMGMALRDVDRGRVTVSTKVGRLLKSTPVQVTDLPWNWVDAPRREIVYDYSYDGVMRSVEDSLERTGLDSFDILYCHDIDEASDDPVVLRDHLRTYLSSKGGYIALERLRDSGAVKAIGLGANSWQTCDFHARETDVDLFLLAGRFTLLEQEALDSFLPLCLRTGKHVVVGGPYNSGILATGSVDNAHYNYAPAPPGIRARVAQIERLCAKHATRLRDAALKFPLCHPAVVSVIPGGVSEQQMRDNAQAVSMPIPDGLRRDLIAAGLVHPSYAETMAIAA